MDFYEKLLSFKAINKLSWNSIGDIISKEPATIRIAVQRKSLTNLEKREIEQNLFLEKEDSKSDNKGNQYDFKNFIFEGKEIPGDLIAKHFIDNKDVYFNKSEYLKLWIEKIVETKIKERLDNLGFKTTIVKK